MVKTSPSNAKDAGSSPGQGAKISHASQPKSQNIKQKQYCDKFNRGFINGPHQKKILKTTVVIGRNRTKKVGNNVQFFTLSINK